METTRRTPPVTLIAAVVGLALVAAMITRTSEAAFTATTDNTGNTFSAGTVVLSDDDAVSALFTLADLEPGETQTACIEVTYSGSLTTPSGVKLYSGGYTDVPGADPASAGLSGYLNVTVEEGTGATFGDCSSFAATSTIVPTTTLASFDTTYAAYASGAGAWTPTSTPESVSYRFTVELDAATPNAEQGASTNAVAFVWEVQS